MGSKAWSDWIGNCNGEALGVFLIVLFGDAVVFTAVLNGVMPDLATLVSDGDSRSQPRCGLPSRFPERTSIRVSRWLWHSGARFRGPR